MSELDAVARARLILADPTSLESEWLAACDILEPPQEVFEHANETWRVLKRLYNDALDAWIGITVGLVLFPFAAFVMSYPLALQGILLGVLLAIIGVQKRDKPYLFGIVSGTILPVSIISGQFPLIALAGLFGFCLTRVFLLERDAIMHISKDANLSTPDITRRHRWPRRPLEPTMPPGRRRSQT